MNVYLIEDSPVKAEHLPAFLSQIESVIRTSFVAVWNNPVNECAVVENLARALNDPSGLILLDLDLDDARYKEAVGQLLQRYVDASQDFLSIYKGTFFEQDKFALAAVILTIGKHLGRRILICTTAYEQSNGPVLTKLGQTRPAEQINWPADRTPFTWSEEDIKAVRVLAESHFRRDYDTAAAAWNKTRQDILTGEWDGTKSKGLFPTGPDTHNASELLKNKTRLKTVQPKVTSLTTTLLGACKVSANLGQRDCVFFLKGVERNRLHLESVCRLLEWKVVPALGVNDWIIDLDAHYQDGAPATALCALQAIKTSKKPGANQPPSFEISASGRRVVMNITLHCNDEADARSTAETVRLTPTQRINRDGRPDDPGTIVLALDYIRPDKIECVGKKVVITKNWSAEPLS